jgi:hypothetical protein
VLVEPAAGERRGTAVLVPPWKIRSAGVVSGWSRALAAAGREVWLHVPPHHLERSRGARSGEGFVSTDLRALRARYPDRQHYAIVHGQVRPLSLYRNRAWVIGGNASTEGVRALNVPQRWHAELEGLAPRAERRAIEEAGEPFVAEVAFGQRLEPWIEQIQAQ